MNTRKSVLTMAKRYNEVHAVLFYWAEDDLGVEFEVTTLTGVFQDTYQFSSVAKHKIPSRKPYSTVERILDDFKRSCSDRNNLLIVYYGGHGGLVDGKMMWSPYRFVRSILSLSCTY